MISPCQSYEHWALDTVRMSTFKHFQKMFIKVRSSETLNRPLGGAVFWFSRKGLVIMQKIPPTVHFPGTHTRCCDTIARRTRAKPRMHAGRRSKTAAWPHMANSWLKMQPGGMPWATTAQASNSHAQIRVNSSRECHESLHMPNSLCLNPLI